jgi:phosphate-selective porin OprO/OprP
MIDLNDQLATANGVAGRKQTVHTAGLNWYVNRNVGFMFNYLHGDIAKQMSATNVGDVGDVGAKFDAFTVRTHIAF